MKEEKCNNTKGEEKERKWRYKRAKGKEKFNKWTRMKDEVGGGRIEQKDSYRKGGGRTDEDD
jgi:hypothetical protein